MKYHSNGCIMATGLFEEGEPYKAEYYDDQGSLIYLDDGMDMNYDSVPGLINNNLIHNNVIGNLLDLINNNPDAEIYNNQD